ncbi:telomere length regulation protein TEL2 homolog [Telopea speciosissima]|uniref:telomere length regulation protein TEL2 homolog n=1 Tax=Telopea speciosissima TaxID=54955 RepID=UPI001CC4B612|nr:telomere length regulation protein TEL2 homolog [Telopea speciosissima]
MEESTRKRRELESEILEKVGEVVSAIREAKYVDHVICSLHSIAVHLFPVDSSRLTGCVDSRFRNQLLSGRISSPFERDEWWDVFYHGAAFPTLARVLIYNVALDWLACFPLSARTHVYDSFFVKGPPFEVVQAIIPALLKNGIKKDTDLNVVCSNVERILVLCLLDHNGVLQMARDFGGSCSSEKFTNKLLKPDMLVFTSMIAQLVASIPDKARLGAPAALSSDQFFKQVIIQLLAGAEERSVEICYNEEALDQSVSDGTFLFVGETFSRICRRGFADILLAEVIPRILGHIRGCLSSDVDIIDHNLFKSKTNFQFWFKMIETIKDSYAVERLSERLLHQLATEHITDIEAYWTLWILFHRTFRNQASIRSIFVDKCLLWKVFPVCCLRWILQFAVLDCPPSSDSLTKGQNTQGLIDIVQRLVGVWSKRQFVQSAAMEQQTYVTAAVGLSLEQMSKEELETTKDVMPLILQGVSCRLESPVTLVRRMASCIALVFSKVVDPKNPLYLDDSCSGETIDWEFGFNRQPKRIPASSDCVEKADDEVKSFVSELNKGISGAADGRKNNNVKGRYKKSELKLVDPDEIVDPATLNNDYSSDEDKDDDDYDDDSENSECLSDSSLQPYDLSDDDGDLKKKFSQLVDLVGALRKPDDPDSVERALDVAEKLVRASPDELQHVSGELVRTLVQVRCSDFTIEGEEDSAEGKRQQALVALLVTCPFESVAAVNKLLYSPNVDISQRILILDVMTDAAQELADAISNRPRHPQGNLISTSEQPWFLPQSKGPLGAGSWKEASETGTSLSWSYRYERNLPLKPSQIKIGKSRRWSLRSEKMQQNQLEYSKNKFPLYAAAFMLPAMQGFDKKRHGVDLLGGDFIVLGKLIYMLGVCMRCVAMHPEAMALAPALLDMLSSREVSHHVEAYVRRSVLFAASCILEALHPSFVASALVEGNAEISNGLEWIRTWALHVVESETNTECSTMALTCLRLHTEMALQASRVLESTDNTFKAKGTDVSTNLLKGEIKITYSNMGYQI